MRQRGAGRIPRKRSHAGLVFAALLMFVNLLLSLFLRVSDRRQVLHAIENDEKASLLYFGEKTTKTE